MSWSLWCRLTQAETWPSLYLSRHSESERLSGLPRQGVIRLTPRVAHVGWIYYSSTCTGRDLHEGNWESFATMEHVRELVDKHEGMREPSPMAVGNRRKRA